MTTVNAWAAGVPGSRGVQQGMTRIPANRPSLAGPLALMLGLLLAQGVIYLSTGWRDGFQDPGVWALKRHFLRLLPWTLALAAATGWVLEVVHGRWVGQPPGTPLAGWPWLPVLARLFLHFPFYGFIVLFQFMGILAGGLFRGLAAKARGQAPPAPAKDAVDGGFMDSTALWMMLGPLAGTKDTEGRTLSFGPIGAELIHRAPRLFPFLLLALWVWTGAEGEDSGERVNAFWLSLAGMVWLGDFLLLTWMHRPRWLIPPSALP